VLEAEGIALGWNNKAACTSIRHALMRCKRLTCQQVLDRRLRTRIYLRHPITRLASAWAYFTPANNFPTDPVWRNKGYEYMREHPSINQFIDGVLGGALNEHWSPQLVQHGLTFDEIYQLEKINETWPSRFKLEHLNQGRIDKPVVTHRLDELFDLYKDDLDAWHKAQ
jgi:hypothetical protein